MRVQREDTVQQGSLVPEASLLGGFRRIAVVGSGAQGKVWKAECVEDVHGIVPIGTVVALKIKNEQGDDLDAQWQKTESRINELKVMNHPNVVHYLGCFREKALDQEKHIVVQEFLEGETLKERLDALNKWNPSRNRLGLDIDKALDIIRQTAAGLGYTASINIFHRDIKPGNIFLCKDGKVKVIDFGVAKQSDGTITEEGNIRGSWNYLAPDFADGVFRGDQQSDIFSVGVVLHEIITGRLPYLSTNGDDTAAYFARWSKASEESPIRIVSNTRRLLLGIDAIFDKTLTPDRDARYKDFAHLSKALENVRFVEQRHGDKTYRRLQFIGEGGFGEVFKARWLERDMPVAVKMLKNADGAARFRAEAEVMKKLDSSCFTRFVDFFEEDDHAFLVMSFLDGMPGNSLRDAINRSRFEVRQKSDTLSSGGLPKELVFSAFERYARGLALMHKHKPSIVHRDIKPTNLYFPAEHPEQVTIMDFGIVRMGDSSTASGITPCTFDYAPPEIVMTADRGGPSMDIFALGLCMYEALTGKMAYPRIAGGQQGMLQFIERCKALQPPVFDDPRVTGDHDLLKFLQWMTDPDVTKRLTDADRVAEEIRKLFYRDVESETSATAFFDSSVDKTVAIDDDRLVAWFEAWKKANPVDDKRLMELYREQWLKEHESGEQQSVRKLAGPSRWKKPLLMLASAAMAGCVFALLQFWNSDRVNRHDTVSVKSARMVFEADFNALLVLDPVESRRERLETAESRLDRATGASVDVQNDVLYKTDSEDEARLRGRIDRLKQVSVGVIENQCNFKVEIAGKTVYAGERERLSFEKGLAASCTINAFGYEAKKLPSDFDGKTIVLKNGDFVPAAVCVNLPQDMDGSVTCLFENAVVTNALWLKPRERPYHCVFRRRGYEDKRQSFTVTLGTDVHLEELGDWSASLVEVTRGDLDGGVSCTVDGKPSDSKMMLYPGEHVVKYSRRGYGDLSLKFMVEVGLGRSVPLPSTVGTWNMTPVRADLPDLESGVQCLIDGRIERNRTFALLPGLHTLRYERAGYLPQSNVTFVVSLATPIVLPGPKPWVAEKVRVSIPEISGVTAKFNGKVVSGILLLEPDVKYKIKYEEKKTGRHQEVSFLVRNNTPMAAPDPKAANWITPPPSDELPMEMKMAREYFEFEAYDDAFEYYYKAFANGYPLGLVNLQRVKKSFEEAHADVKRKIKDWQQRPSHRDSHRNIEALEKRRSDLKRKYQEMTATSR